MKKLFYTFSLLLTVQFIHAQITSPAPYCDATFDDNSFAVDDHISSVQIGNLNNVTNAQFAAPHYVFYNNLTAPTLKADSSYKLYLKFQVSGGCGFGAWIDFNHNNSFEASEKISGTTGADYLDLGVARDSTIITIPHNAITGITRMRIRIVEDDLHHGLVGSRELACNPGVVADSIMDWGETEDYNVNISGVGPSGVAVVEAGQITATPNPFHQELSIQLEEEASTITITDAIGRICLQQSVSGRSITVSTAMLPSGPYLVAVTDKMGNYKVLHLVKE
ncbi:MAG: T9SS type A sorting domain-containing protein [Chitinophagales bacterium]